MTDKLNGMAWASDLCTLLDRIEIVIRGDGPRKVLVDDPGRTLTERLRDNAHSDELGLMALSDDAEEAATILDAVRDLCRARFEIAEKHGLEVVMMGETSGLEQ